LHFAIRVGADSRRFVCSAFSFHEAVTVHLLRRVLVVCATSEADAVSAMLVRPRITVDVIELQERGRGAPVAFLVVKRAAATGRWIPDPIKREVFERDRRL
jgi:hypothetical protein